MEQVEKKRLYENSLNFKRSLDRIIDKYSSLENQDGLIEVDLCNVKHDTLQHYINLSKRRLNTLQSKSLADLSEVSLNAQDITGDSQLDFSHKEDGGDETCGSTVQFPMDDHEGTVGSLEASLKSFSESELQPEDQDEDLQMSLCSNGSSLVELYPSMVSRIERAWHRQNISVAADSVLRRYRRWRQQSKRSNLNSTFDVPLRHANCYPKKMSCSLLRECSSSPVKRQLVGAETTPRSAYQAVTGLNDRQTQPQSAGKERGSLRRERPHPVLVMDFSDTFKPKEISLNESFSVGQLSPPKLAQLGEHVSIYTARPPQPRRVAPEASEDPPFRLKRPSGPSLLQQRSGCSTSATETPAVRERLGIYSSPLRQSPSKARVMTSLSRSPSRSPKEYSMDRCSREPMRLRSLSVSLPPSPQRPLRMLYPQDFHQSLQPQSRSPVAARAADGHHRLGQHLSFDSSLASRSTSYSPKKVDEDFMKLYHKFACLNKSTFFNGPPCRLCARSSKATRGHSSSDLAMSPHRSVLRKRHRELGWEGEPQTKRSREEYCTYSTGSKRHRELGWDGEPQTKRSREEYCTYSPGSKRHRELGWEGEPQTKRSREEYCTYSPGSKRHRELGWEGKPQTKCSREEYCTYSPGSKRHRREMLRDCPSPPGLPHLGLTYSPSKRGTQRPAALQEAWMSRHRPGSAADFSGLYVGHEENNQNKPTTVQQVSMRKTGVLRSILQRHQ